MLLTVSKDPAAIWVEDYPVIVPFFDAVYAPSPDAFDLAEEWATDLYLFKFVRDPKYMVYLPQETRTKVAWVAERIGLC